MNSSKNASIPTSSEKNHEMLEHYDFQVPDELIAQNPLAKRRSSRILVSTRNSIHTDHYVTDLPDLLPASALLIFNDTKVFPSRMHGKLTSGGKVELFLVTYPSGQQNAKATALGKPVRKLKIGTEIFFPGDLVATVTGKEEKGAASTPTIRLQFNQGEKDLFSWIDKYGKTPLPPYIKRDLDSSSQSTLDRSRYQTVYAKQSGSVAAPTAGLHFDNDLIEDLRAHGMEISYVTLHVGAGTFLPIKTENITEHQMHEELYCVPSKTWQAIKRAKHENRKIICVGTTSFRCLESFSLKGQSENDWDRISDTWMGTDLYIYPDSSGENYHSRVFDGMITNFHQPKSTLYLLISSLVGVSKAKEIYKAAMKNNFRFYSYGDSSLLWF